MSRTAETPLEAARRYARDQQEKVDQQKELIRRLSAIGRPTTKAKQDLAVMEKSLILLLGRVARLEELGTGQTP